MVLLLEFLFTVILLVHFAFQSCPLIAVYTYGRCLKTHHCLISASVCSIRVIDTLAISVNRKFAPVCVCVYVMARALCSRFNACLCIVPLIKNSNFTTHIASVYPHVLMGIWWSRRTAHQAVISMGAWCRLRKQIPTVHASNGGWSDCTFTCER